MRQHGARSGIPRRIGNESDTAADGTVTVYGYNLLKQKISETKKGLAADGSDDIVTLHTYDLENRVLMTAVTNTASGLGYVAVRNAYDSVGRLTNSFDRLGNATVYSYPGTGNRQVAPSGVTNVTERYLDGQTKRVLENGTVKQSYAYGINPDGTRWAVFYTGPDGTASPVWSRTTTAFLGRIVLEERPAFGGGIIAISNAYDSVGRLVSTSSSCGSALLFRTLYAYNGAGEQAVTALDADGNGVLGFAGPDRVSSNDVRYVQIGGDWWQESRNFIYPDGASARLAGTQRERLTGLGTSSDAGLLTSESVSVDLPGNETVSRTYVQAAEKTVTQVADTPGSALDAVQVSVNGLTVLSASTTGVTNSMAYDALGRQIFVSTESGSPSRPRTVSSLTHYNALGQVDYTEDAATNRTSYVYDSLGRRVAVTNAVGDVTHTTYNSEGRVIRTWGATYPIEYGYDMLGHMVSMKTFRDENGTGDETRWLYDEPTGLLTNKVYADGKGTAYTYTPSGRLATRIWARDVTTTYDYDVLGQLVTVDYSDATPSACFTYDRLGRHKVAQTFLSVSGEIISSLTNTYSATTLAFISETQNGVVIARTNDALGRTAGFSLGDDYSVTYGYDSFGRFSSVTSFVLAVSAANYSYLSGTGLLAGMANTAGLSWSRTFEPNRDLITAVSNLWGTSAVSSFLYENDALGRRTRRLDSTPALSVTNSFGYNARSEVTEAVMYTNTYGYVYDPIGNRLFSTANAETNRYAANALNQYAVISNQVNPVQILPAYDLDGNMLTNGVWAYTWDAENRLASAVSNGVLVVTNVYDHQSRRIKKYSHEGAEIAEFVYDGWNVISEKISDQQSTITNYYTWGLDLSGSLQGAGGVGGLLAVTTSNPNQPDSLNTYYPSFDANGNVTEYVDASGAVQAHFVFDAFGNTAAQSDAFAYRFSTKYLDAETGMYYYGYRHYHSEIGRWLSKDPMEEAGGKMLYGFVNNNSINLIDVLGMMSRKEVEAAFQKRKKDTEAANIGCPCICLDNKDTYNIRGGVSAPTIVYGFTDWAWNSSSCGPLNSTFYWWDCYSAGDQGDRRTMGWSERGRLYFKEQSPSWGGHWPTNPGDPNNLAMASIVVYEKCVNGKLVHCTNRSFV